jgi:alkanesulfonate monooxygenase SsuD/methylene tetrahydromethanopterin reductase-like flavin-dependent oxidoreductase (luciferase family)
VVGKSDAEVGARAVSRDTAYSTQNAFVGTPPQIVEQMLEFVAAGNDYFMIDILGLPHPDILDMVLEEIVPKVKKGG